MGVEHGRYCLGCCWLLFVILFPLGIMNIAAMATVTVLIFAERALPFGQRVVAAAAVGLVAYGVLVMLMPDLLPAGDGAAAMVRSSGM
jgi:predicted metal-binding membrane protein